MKIFQGKQLFCFHFVSFFKGDQLLKNRICFRSSPLIKVLLPIEANKKQQKLFVFVKMAKNMEVYLLALKSEFM